MEWAKQKPCTKTQISENFTGCLQSRKQQFTLPSSSITPPHDRRQLALNLQKAISPAAASGEKNGKVSTVRLMLDPALRPLLLSSKLLPSRKDRLNTEPLDLLHVFNSAINETAETEGAIAPEPSEPEQSPFLTLRPQSFLTIQPTMAQGANPPTPPAGPTPPSGATAPTSGVLFSPTTPTLVQDILLDRIPLPLHEQLCP
ncbi:unnamed protein product [Cylindrotheca closterium]|uniref:Uncharacterized protein n=1 Tax=Cylindrotheca closterium TaxID=2856 RepID=A0AAD2FX44_9STRA|nr:unnamed protein product [Cylindrotheca closterium]